MRRRQSAIVTINQELDRLGLRAVPPISETMPLDAPHIRFLLVEQETGATSPVSGDEETEEEEEFSIEATTTAFKVAELAAATKLRWSPSLGQNRGNIKSGPRCPQGIQW